MVSRRIRSSVRQNIIQQDKLIREEVITELSNTGRTIRLELQANTSTWNNRPKFGEHLTVARTLMSVEVKADDDTKAGKIFNWVDRGTGRYGPQGRPYIIRPKRRRGGGGLLHFRTNYIAKSGAAQASAHVAKANIGPGKAFGPWVAAKQVVHPGIEPRNFTEIVVRSLKPDMKRRIENAIRRAVRRSAQ